MYPEQSQIFLNGGLLGTIFLQISRAHCMLLFAVLSCTNNLVVIVVVVGVCVYVCVCVLVHAFQREFSDKLSQLSITETPAFNPKRQT
jgi:ABC-type lipoprotein release transport system permease subunit